MKASPLNYTLVIGAIVGSALFQSMWGILICGFLGLLGHFLYHHVWAPYVYKSDWQTSVNQCFIALHAKMAKCDGAVSTDEIRLFRDIFYIPPSEEQCVSALYDNFRATADGADAFAYRLLKLSSKRSDVKTLCVESLCYVAVHASSHVEASAYYPYIVRIARILEISADDVNAMIVRLKMSGADGYQQFQNASFNAQKKCSFDVEYKLLGLATGASLEDVKKSYRRKMHKLHPDKLSAMNASDHEKEQAQQQLHAIKDAYETLKKTLET
jgi:DnaJ like chaperone protein